MIESNDLPDWNNPEIQMHIFPLNAIDHIDNLVPGIKVYVELLKEKQYCPPGAFFIGIKDEELAFICKLMQCALAGDIESKISIQHYTDILCTGEGQTDLDDIKDQCNASINFQAAVHLVSCARLLKLQLQYFNISMYNSRLKIIGDITLEHVLNLGANLQGVLRDKYCK